ncbi:hypothetical protein DITRI_Ditri01bG0154300 [Diplodiscus trichospermus]
MAVAGLWAVFLRPMLIRYAADMIGAMGYSVHRILTRSIRRSSSVFSTNLPYSGTGSFLYCWAGAVVLGALGVEPGT